MMSELTQTHTNTSASAWSLLSGLQRSHIEAGDGALHRLFEHSKVTFQDHMLVGRGLQEIQDAALNACGSNAPTGKAYNAAYRAIVSNRPRYAQVEKGYASRARWMWNNRDEVEDWWGSLTDRVKLEINHPQAVKRAFEKHLSEREDDEAGGLRWRQTAETQKTIRRRYAAA